MSLYCQTLNLNQWTINTIHILSLAFWIYYLIVNIWFCLLFLNFSLSYYVKSCSDKFIQFPFITFSYSKFLSSVYPISFFYSEQTHLFYRFISICHPLCAVFSKMIIFLNWFLKSFYFIYDACFVNQYSYLIFTIHIFLSSILSVRLLLLW